MVVAPSTDEAGANTLASRILEGLADRVSEVDRTGEVVIGTHKSDKPLYQIVHVAEGAALAAVAINGDGFTLQRLNDEIGHHPSIVRVHAWPVGIENSCNFYFQTMLAMIVKKERFSTALTLVIAGPDTIRVDMAPI